ncbi:MAG TPA: universal stress protein [Vicinamibacterales bacterium]|nr:universal stress protein [Vicinamibacterales bacterium]
MVARSILVPTDFSPTSDAALHYATQMALALGARLYLMHVPGKTGEHFEANYPLGRFETATRERLSSFLTKDELEQLRPEYALRVGAPAEEIVRYADLCDADLIIMGTHGRTGIAHALIGSVAEQVARVAPCPVLLVRARRRAAVAQGAEVRVAPVKRVLA